MSTPERSHKTGTYPHSEYFQAPDLSNLCIPLKVSTVAISEDMATSILKVGFYGGRWGAVIISIDISAILQLSAPFVLD
jgi:hypothetical protein